MNMPLSNNPPLKKVHGKIQPLLCCLLERLQNCVLISKPLAGTAQIFHSLSIVLCLTPARQGYLLVVGCVLKNKPSRVLTGTLQLDGLTFNHCSFLFFFYFYRWCKEKPDKGNVSDIQYKTATGKW